MSARIKILYEDKDILAVDKPSGVLTHPTTEQNHNGVSREDSEKERSIFSFFLKKYPKLEIAHRLDKETSGVLLFAKNSRAHEFLKTQFKNRQVNKIYNAIVVGFIKNDKGIINKPIGRSPADFRRHLSGRGARGKLRDAVTEYKVLKRFEASACENFSSCALPVTKKKTGETLGDKNFHKPPLLSFTYLEIKPKTGRTHQIRVHMKFINHPVVCDSLYNPKGACPIGFSRLALHAFSIEFQNLKSQTIKVESPLPKEFKRYK